MIFFLFASNSAGADTLYQNAKIYTVDTSMPWADELSVSGGKITCVGASSTCAAHATEIIDMSGRFMMPGVIDAHNHVRYAMGSSFLSVAEAGEYQDFRNMIEAHAQKFPDLKWIQGDGWSYSIFDGGMPTYKDLDGLANGRPIMLTSYDAHTQLLNRAAMEAFGITSDTTRTPLGTVMRDATGVFKTAIYISEQDQKASYDVLPEPDSEDMYQSFIGNLNEASASGITSIV